jgi:hypothetical protein
LKNIDLLEKIAAYRQRIAISCPKVDFLFSDYLP